MYNLNYTREQSLRFICFITVVLATLSLLPKASGLRVAGPSAERDAYANSDRFRWSFGGSAFAFARDELINTNHSVILSEDITTQFLTTNEDILVTGVMNERDGETSVILDWISQGKLAYIMCDRKDQSYCDKLFPDLLASDYHDTATDVHHVYMLVDDHPLFQNYTIGDRLIIEGGSVAFKFSSNTNLTYQILASHEHDSVVPAIIEVKWGMGKVILIGDGTMFSQDLFFNPVSLDVFANMFNNVQEILHCPTYPPTPVPTTTASPTRPPTKPPKTDLVVISDIAFIEATTIVGNLTLTNNSTLQITQDTVITVTGCLIAGDGNLEIEVDANAILDGKRIELFKYTCIESTFSEIRATSTDQCNGIGIANSEYSATSLSVLLNFKDTCSASISRTGISWVILVILPIVIAMTL